MMDNNSINEIHYLKRDHGILSILISDFAIAAKPIYQIMPLFTNTLKEYTVILNNLTNVNFLCTNIGNIMITLIYKSKIIIFG